MMLTEKSWKDRFNYVCGYICAHRMLRPMSARALRDCDVWLGWNSLLTKDTDMIRNHKPLALTWPDVTVGMLSSSLVPWWWRDREPNHDAVQAFEALLRAVKPGDEKQAYKLFFEMTR